MKIAGKICIYTNDAFTLEELAEPEKQQSASSPAK